MTETGRKAALDGLKNEIKVAMLLAGLNGESLAKKLHVSHTTACRWVKEPDKMTLRQWRQLNTVLHIQSSVNFSKLSGFEN